MAKVIGRRVTLGIAKESTRGQGAAPTFALPNTELSYQERSTKVVSGERYGHIDDSTDQFVTEQFSQGNVNGEIKDQSFPLLLLAALGSINTTSLGSGAYRHTLTESNSNQHPSLAFSVSDPASEQDKMFKLVMMNSLAFNVNVGELSTFESDFEGKTSVNTNYTPAQIAENRFVASNACVFIADDLGDLDSANSLPITEMTLTISKNVMKEFNACTVDPVDIHNQQFAVEGSFTLNVTDDVYRDLMRDNSYKALRLKLHNESVAIGSNQHPTIQIDLPRVSFMDWERDNELDTIVSQSISFKGHADIANGKTIIDQIQVINTVSSY